MIKNKSRIKELATEALNRFGHLKFDAQVSYMMVQEPSASKSDCRRILKATIKQQGVK